MVQRLPGKQGGGEGEAGGKILNKVGYGKDYITITPRSTYTTTTTGNSTMGIVK